VPTLSPGDDRREGFTDRFRIRTIMEHLAAATGGLDELLEVMARDQSSGYAFLRLAEACLAHGREDLALEWAEQGRAAYPGELRLLELLVDLHGRGSIGRGARRRQGAVHPHTIRGRLGGLASAPRRSMRGRPNARPPWPGYATRSSASDRRRRRAGRRGIGPTAAPWWRSCCSTMTSTLPGGRPRRTGAAPTSNSSSPNAAPTITPPTRSRPTAVISTALSSRSHQSGPRGTPARESPL
jgi:hypothetical protein